VWADVWTDVWAEESANEVEMGGVAGQERKTTPNPTPARWGSTARRPVPVTPTKGSKRMAMGTPRPRPTRHYRPANLRPMPIGFAAASALEQTLAAIAGVEQKMEEKVAVLKGRMMEGMGVLAADENEREARTVARLLADAEVREKRLAVKMLTMEGIQSELVQKARWEIKQWEDMARLLDARRKDIGEVKRTVDKIAESIAEQRGAQPVPIPALGQAARPASFRPAAFPTTLRAISQAPLARIAAAPVANPEPEAMEGVVAETLAMTQDDPVEDWSNMEGVEREGLYGS